MNTITEEGKSIRQIVPADFVFLSQADRQICKALHGLLCTLAGHGGYTGAIVMTGMSCVFGSQQVLPTTVTLRKGTVLYDDRLWDLEEDYQFTTTYHSDHDGGWAAQVEASFSDYEMYFVEETAPPSPVYGADETVTVSPHKRNVCRILRWDEPVAAPSDKHTALSSVVRMAGSQTGGFNGLWQ